MMLHVRMRRAHGRHGSGGSVCVSHRLRRRRVPHVSYSIWRKVLLMGIDEGLWWRRWRGSSMHGTVGLMQPQRCLGWCLNRWWWLGHVGRNSRAMGVVIVVGLLWWRRLMQLCGGMWNMMLCGILGMRVGVVVGRRGLLGLAIWRQLLRRGVCVCRRGSRHGRMRAHQFETPPFERRQLVSGMVVVNMVFAFDGGRLQRRVDTLWLDRQRKPGRHGYYVSW